MQARYYTSAIIAFLIWGTFSLALKPLAAYPALDILLYRVGIAATVIVLISLLFRYKVTKNNLQYIRTLAPKEKTSIIINLLSSAILLALNWFIFIYVMNNVSVSATSLAYLICPILTTVLASLFLKEKLNSGQWLAVGISICSCLLLSYGHLIDMLYSFFIALSYAAYLVLQKSNKQLDKFFSLTLHILGSALLLIPLYKLVPSSIVHDTDFYFYTFLIAVLFTIIPLFLNTYALKGLDSSVVGVLLYLNPILAFMIAHYYFKEDINTIQAIAYALILTAVVIFNLSYLEKIKKVEKTIT